MLHFYMPYTHIDIEPKNDSDIPKATPLQAQQHVQKEYFRPGNDEYGDAFLPHAFVHAFEGPAVIVVQRYDPFPRLETPRLLLGVENASHDPIYANPRVRAIPIKKFIPFPLENIANLEKERDAEILSGATEKELGFRDRVRKSQTDEYNAAMERRRMTVKPETCEILTEAYGERLQICRDFQEHLYEEALEEMPSTQDVARLFRMIHLLSAAEKPTRVMGIPPEYYIRAAAEQKVSRYEPKYGEKKEGSDDSEREIIDVIEKDKSEYDKELHTAMLRLETFMEMPVPGLTPSDPRKVLTEACEKTLDSLVKDCLVQFGPQFGVIGITKEQEETIDTTSSELRKDFAIEEQLQTMKASIDQDSGEIILVNENGDRVYLTFLGAIPEEKNIFNILRMAQMSKLRDQAFTYEFEKAKAQIALAQKMADTIQDVHRVLTAKPKKGQQDTTYLLRKAKGIVSPYRKNLTGLYTPYLIDTIITPENIEEVSTMAGFLELTRRGQLEYQGYDDSFNPMRRSVKTTPSPDQIGSLFPKEKGELSIIKNDSVEASNLPAEYFESRAKIPHMAIRIEQGWPPNFVEHSTRIHKKARTVNNPKPETNGENRYVVSSLAPITTSGADYIGIPHGSMAVPVEVVITVDGNPPQRFLIPKAHIHRAEDGTYYAPVDSRIKNQTNVSYSVTMESAYEMIEPEALEIADPRAINALRKVIQDLRDTSDSLSLLADNLEHALRVRKKDNTEVVDLYTIARAISSSSRYSIDGSRHVVNLDNPIPDLPDLVDPLNGTLKLQCNLSNQLVAHIMAQVLSYDPEMAVYVASGYSASGTERQNNTLVISKAQTHAIVKLVKNGKVAYFDGVPRLYAEGSQTANFHLPPHVREQAISRFNEVDETQSQLPITEINEQVIGSRWDQTRAREAIDEDPIAQRPTDFLVIQQQLNRQAIENVQRNRDSFFEILDSKLGGLLSQKAPTSQSQTKVDLLWKQSIQKGSPLQKLLSATSRFSSGQITAGEFYDELRYIERQLEKSTDEATLMRLRTGNGIGLNDPQTHPDIFFAMQELIAESKKSIEQ